MPTVSSIISNAREDLKIDPGKNIWTDSQLTRWLNEGAAMLAAETDWKDIEKSSTITLVASTATYTPATDYHRLMKNSVVFTDSNGAESRVKYVELFELKVDVLDLTVTGNIPEKVYETGGELGFYPVPNATAATGTLGYSYYEWPDTYTANDTPAFPAEWHFLLEHYVEYRAWGVLPGREQASALGMQKWQLGVNKMKIERLRREGPTLSWRVVTKETKNI